MHGGTWIACALEQERRQLRRNLPEGIRVFKTGLGARRTGLFLEDFFRSTRPDLLVFAGTAGQLAPELPMGFVAVARSWLFEDGRSFDLSFPLERLPQSLSSSLVDRGLTVRLPVFEAEARLRLHREFGASVCDMESASVLEAARQADVPCLVAKVVSDTADSKIYDFIRHFRGNMEILARSLRPLVEIPQV